MPLTIPDDDQEPSSDPTAGWVSTTESSMTAVRQQLCEDSDIEPAASERSSERLLHTAVVGPDLQPRPPLLCDTARRACAGVLIV